MGTAVKRLARGAYQIGTGGGVKRNDFFPG